MVLGDNLLNTFWESIRILSNQKEIQNADHNTQNIQIITRYSKNKDFAGTLGVLAGEARGKYHKYSFILRLTVFVQILKTPINRPTILDLVPDRKNTVGMKKHQMQKRNQNLYH